MQADIRKPSNSFAFGGMVNCHNKCRCVEATLYNDNLIVMIIQHLNTMGTSSLELLILHSVLTFMWDVKEVYEKNIKIINMRTM